MSALSVPPYAHSGLSGPPEMMLRWGEKAEGEDVPGGCPSYMSWGFQPFTQREADERRQRREEEDRAEYDITQHNTA